MKYLLIAIWLLGACSAQFYTPRYVAPQQEQELETPFENDFGDLDAMTNDIDEDDMTEENFLEDAQDEEDPFDIEDDQVDDLLEQDEYQPENDFLAEGEQDESEEGELEDDEANESSYVRISFLPRRLLFTYNSGVLEAGSEEQGGESPHGGRRKTGHQPLTLMSNVLDMSKRPLLST